MLADAWREVRQHPSRVFATILAIAISVAFMAASSTFLQTEKEALGKQGSIQLANTDVVAAFDWSKGEEPPRDPGAFLAGLKAAPGVAAVEPSFTTFGTLSKGEVAKQLQLLAVPGESFRWSRLIEGQWAQKANELTLTEQVAKSLNAKVGDTIKFDGRDATVVGLADDPNTRLLTYAYVGPERFNSDEQSALMYLINLTDDANTDETIAALKKISPGFDVVTGEQYREDYIKGLAGSIDLFKYLFAVFQFIALVVGMIIIANTFTILITQRRRQIGLLRAVGASSGQVQRKFFAEATLLGALGSLLGIALGVGIAAIGSAFTGSLAFGLGLPWTDWLVAFVIGVVITVLAAMIPIIKTTQVSPLEALRPVLSADKQKRASRVRLVVCGLFLLIGVAMMVTSQTIARDSWPIAWAMGGVFFITISVLGGAPLYVAGMLRAGGALINRTGPTARLATMNSVRNPSRAAATAVALMLAMGLIVSLQVATATVRTTVQQKIDEQYPIDLTLVSTSGKLSAAAEGAVQQLNAVQDKTVLTGGEVRTDSPEQTGGQPPLVYSLDGNAAKVAPGITNPVPDDVAIVASGGRYTHQKSITLKTLEGGTLTLKLQSRNGVSDGLLVSEATMKKLVSSPQQIGYWIKLTDRQDIGNAMQKLQPLLLEEQGSLEVDGGALMSYMLNQMLTALLVVVTALLGVAVVIALVGVANTLGLSVIERTRESALLRALGMQRAKLRVMLLIESVMLALAGTLVGLLGGASFAWLVLRAFFRQVELDTSDLMFSIDPWQTLALIGIAVVCAALASVLPGRRAANASPTEALAED